MKSILVLIPYEKPCHIWQTAKTCQFSTQNINLTLWFWPTHPTMIMSHVVMSKYLKDWLNILRRINFFPLLLIFMIFLRKKVILLINFFSDKSHFLYCLHKISDRSCFVGEVIVWLSSSKNFLSLKFDRLLEFVMILTWSNGKLESIYCRLYMIQKFT